MRSITYADLTSNPVFTRKLSRMASAFSDALYRKFARKNEFGMTGRQTDSAIRIVQNGDAGCVLAKLYACTGCGISQDQFAAFLEKYKPKTTASLSAQPIVNSERRETA